MRHGLILFISSVVTFGMASCRKYEDGGYLRDAERNLTGHPKKLVQYTANGIDSLPHVVNGMLGCSDLVLIFGTHGNNNLLYNAYPECGQLKRYGKWHFGSKRRTLVMDLYNEKLSGPIAGELWDIKKLSDNEIWLTKERNGIFYEARLNSVY